MDLRETLTETERLLLMAAAVHELGPAADLSRANTNRVVDQVLQWRGLSTEEIRDGWWEQECGTVHAEVYNALVRMTHQIHRVGAGRVPERPGVPLFEGSGDWGIPGDPSRPACLPYFNSCRLTSEGERIAEELLKRRPGYCRDVEA